MGAEAEKPEELTEEQKEMMSVMGFTDFVSTKVEAAWLSATSVAIVSLTSAPVIGTGASPHASGGGMLT